MKRIAGYLLAGFAAVIPTAATLYAIKAVMDIAGALTGHAFGRYLHESPGLDILIAVVVLCLIGMAVRNVIGIRLARLYEAQLRKVPLVKSVYTTVKQVLAMIANPRSKAFKQMVVVEWPAPGLWTLGCLVSEDAGNGLASIFVLKAPASLEGFTVLVAPDHYRILDMPVENGLRLMLSYGVLDGTSPQVPDPPVSVG